MSNKLALWLEANGVDRDTFAARIGYSRSTVDKLCAPSVCCSPSMTLRDVVFVATRGAIDLVELRSPRPYRGRRRESNRAA